MNINSTIMDLYTKANLNYEIVFDGVINEECFGTNNVIPTVFLLKEANKATCIEKNSNANLCEILLGATKKDVNLTKTYRVICMWTKILEEKEHECWLEDCFDNNFKYDTEIMRKYLNYIAVINICKENGTGESVSSKLEKSIKNYYSCVVNEQIKLINPRLVVCCGTFDYITKTKDSFFYNKINEREITINRLRSGERYFNYENRIYLEMVHPAAYYDYCSMFSRFQLAVKAMSFDSLI